MSKVPFRQEMIQIPSSPNGALDFWPICSMHATFTNIYTQSHPHQRNYSSIMKHMCHGPWLNPKHWYEGLSQRHQRVAWQRHGQYAPLFHWSLAEFMACLAWSSLMVWCFSSRSDVTWAWLIHNHTNQYHNVLLEIYSWLVMYVYVCPIMYRLYKSHYIL